METVMNGVDPNDLRFTQKSISPAFKPPYQGVFLKDTIKKIRRKDMTVSTFPMLEVIQHEGTLWCLNNRRLFVFRKTGVDKIDVQISWFPMHPRLSVVLENAEDTTKMREKNFFPYVKKYKDGIGVHTNPPPPGYPPIPPLQARYHPPTRSTPKCSLTQVPFGQVVCVYIKAEHIASSMTKALTKPSAYRDAKHVCSGQDSKGKAAIAVKEESSGLPSNNPFASKFPSLETHVKPDFISQRMGFNPNGIPEQPKDVPAAKIHASTELADNQLINLESVPSRSCKYPAAAGPAMSPKRPRSETRMEPRIAPGVGESRTDSILQGLGILGPPPKPLKPVTRVTDASLDRQPINLGTISNEELLDKRMNARILVIDDNRVGLLGILSTPANHRNEFVVDMPPSSDLDPLLHHVLATNISRISSPAHAPPRYNSASWGFVISFAKKLGCHLRPRSASAAASTL